MICDSRLRAFQREDIPAVAALWMRVFRQQPVAASPALQAYFREIFFESPWQDAELPSLVHADASGGIVGFLGVMARRMRHGGRPVRVAVATQLMVDEHLSPAYAAAGLLRRFLAGPQDLSLSDGANDAGEKLWRACGGEVAMLYSLGWVRVLRPAQYLHVKLARRLQRRIGTMPLALLQGGLSPLTWAADAMADVAGPSGTRGGKVRPSGPGQHASTLLIEDEPSTATLLWCLRHLGGRRALQPDYTEASLHWLMTQAAAKQNHGPLRKAVLRLPSGDIAGWFLYYARPDGLYQVLQYGARSDCFEPVMQSLFRRARTEGAAALCGSLDPRYARELEALRCRLVLPGYGVLMHARDAALAGAIHRGDAFLSRLEGEWWARFSDPVWSRVVQLPRAPVSGRAPLSQTHGLTIAS